MTVTRPTTWTLPTRDELREGIPVSVGNSNELRDLNRSLTRAWEHNVRLHAATLSSKTGIPGIIFGSGTEIGRGVIRVWDIDARLRIYIYGLRVEVVVTVGGQSITVTRASTTLKWEENSALLTTATIGADGIASVVITAEELSATAELYHVIIQEVENSNSEGVDPANGTQTRVNMVALDDNAVIEDRPLDAWWMQQMDDNARDCEYWRGRGVLHMYPRTRRHEVSSVHWRLDGPYMVASNPWASQAIVNVSVGGSANAAGEVFALSEHERFEDVRDDRRVVVNAAFVTHEFTCEIRPGLDRPQLIWVAFRSNVDTSVQTGVSIISINRRIARLYTEALPDAWMPYPSDRAIVVGTDEGAINTGAKNLLTYNQPAQYVDMAAMLGEGSLGNEQVVISPHPDSGLADLAQLGAIYDSAGNELYASDFDVHNLFRIEIHGVLLEVVGDTPVRQKLAQPGRKASSGMVAQSVASAQMLNQLGTPQIAIRHRGQRNILGQTGDASDNVFHEGHWIFVSGSAGSNQQLTLDIPLIEDPNYAVGSGLESADIFGQVVYMVVQMTAVGHLTQGQVVFRWKNGGSTYSADDEQTAERPLVFLGRGYGASDGVTVADATGAAQTTSHDPVAAAPSESTEHAYTQQYTWPSEGTTSNSPWRVSNVFRAPLSGSYPLIWEMIMRNEGMFDSEDPIVAGDTMLIVSGVHAWIGPRS